MTPDEWIARCAEHMHRLAQGALTADECAAVAAQMVEEPAYSRMEPEAAAEKQQRDEA